MEHNNLLQQSGNSKTFKKRPGTTDRGKDYEHLLIANLILKLVSDERVEDFYLSSNDTNFGSFDDIVLEIKYFGKKEPALYACQLKQKQGKKNLSLGALAAAKGGFSIKEYFDDYQKNNSLQTHGVKLVLYTNSKLEIECGNNSTLQLCIDDKTTPVDFHAINQNELFKSSAEGASYIFTTLEKKYEPFFEKFVLCTGQANVDAIEKDTLVTFKRMFNCDDAIFREYINFIVNWSLIEGKKEKLNKKWMEHVIGISVLSPFVRPLSFSLEDSIDNKTKIFRNAVSLFQVTMIDKEHYDKLKEMWRDVVDNFDDFKQLEQVRMKYQIFSDRIKKKEELIKEDKEVSKLLWLLDKCPLIIDGCSKAYQAIKLCSDRKFIVLTSQTENIDTMQELTKKHSSLFHTLSDLQAKDVYRNFLENFTYFLEGQKEAVLKCLIQGNKHLEECFTTNELVKMVDGPLLVGCQNERLPPCHIDRTLQKVIIDFGVLKESVRNNLFVISGMKNVNVSLPNARIVPVEMIDQQIFKTMDSGGKQQANDLVFVSEHEYQHFDKLCDKKLNIPCHYLRYINNECLEWVKSIGSIDDLRKFRLDDVYTYTVEEHQLSKSENNNINIICANPGMGKSTLMKSLKLNGSSSVWSILVYARNHALYFKRNAPNADNFLQHILNEACKEIKNSLDKKIFETLIKNNRVELIWDGVDEASETSLKSILAIIETVSKSGIKQWITSRKNLQDVLEKRYNVFSMNLKQFDEEEQNKYIEERLGLTSQELTNVLHKIKTNISMFNYNDILGIPLQIYLLTELFHRNKEKYLNLLNEDFTIADLYEHFVEEQFIIYNEANEGYDKNKEANLEKFEKDKSYKMDGYKEAAFGLYFGSKFVRYIRSVFYYTECDKFLIEIRNNRDRVGFIVKVTEDNSPEFAHNSYGEYFAALYLSENYDTHVKDRSFIYNEEYNNIRFFLDLILAKSCKAHIAILHKNCHLLVQCTKEDLTCKDAAGRDVLKVSCAWNKDYPLLKTKKQGNEFLIDDSKFQKSKNIKKVSYGQNAEIFTDAPVHLIKLILLLPFTLTVYDRKTNSFAEEHVPTILFYAVIFDYSSIFDSFETIPLITLTSDFNKDKTLLDLALELKHISCFKKVILIPPYIDFLERNLHLLKHYAKSFEDVFANAVLDSNRKTLMHFVCQNNHKQILYFLIRNYTNVNIVDKHGKTPLHYACEFATLQVVKTLLAYGAEPNIADLQGKYPIHCACLAEYNSLKMIQILMKYGASVNVTDASGKTLLHYVMMNVQYSSEDLNRLNHSSKEIRQGDSYSIPLFGNTTNWYNIAEFFLGNGVDPNTVDTDGKSFLHYICEKSWHETLNMIWENPFMISKNCTYYEEILRNRYYLVVSRTVKLLIEKGAKLDIRDKDNKTPLYYSCEANIPEVTFLLMESGTTDSDAPENKYSISETVKLLKERRIDEKEYHDSGTYNQKSFKKSRDGMYDTRTAADFETFWRNKSAQEKQRTSNLYDRHDALQARLRNIDVGAHIQASLNKL